MNLSINLGQKQIALKLATELINKKNQRISQTDASIVKQQEKIFIPIDSTFLQIKRKLENKDLSTLEQKKCQKTTVSTISNKKYHFKVVAACKKHNISKSDYLAFMQGEDKGNINKIPLIKISTLLKAVRANHFNMLKMLKELNANLNLTTHDGKTILAEAVVLDSPEMVKLLVELGADLYHCKKHKLSPLNQAIVQNNQYMIKLLVELKANVNHIGHSYVTPLVKAVIEDKPDIIKLLINLKADVNQPDGNEHIALYEAVNRKRPHLTQLLIKLGANINCFDHEGQTPLTQAIVNNHLTTVRLLIRLGADVNTPNQIGETPLARAICKYRNQIATLLKRAGANQTMAEEIIRRNVLGHLWGLEGTSTLIWTKKSTPPKHYEATIELGGGDVIYMLNLLRRYINDFFKSHIFPNRLSQQNQLQIQDAFNDAFPIKSNASKMVKKIFINQPCVMMGGSELHAISMVIYKNRLCVFNRGEGSGSSSAYFYVLPTSSVTIHLIHQLTTLYLNTKTFNKMIESLNLKGLGGFTHKLSKAENCTWASGKGAFKVLLVMFTNKKIGHQIYKEFSAFSREKSLKNYFNQSIHYGIDLLKKIQEKLLIKKGLHPSKKLIEDYLVVLKM